MRRVRAAVVLALSLVPAGCGLMPAEAPNLDGTGWRAVLVSGIAPVPGSEPTARFDDDRISGSTGCNRYSGLTRVENSILRVTEVTATLAMCDDPAASIEKVVLEAIHELGSARFEAGDLIIAGTSGEVRFRRDDTVP